ncbi:FAD-dependent oxidoreductase [Pseudomonas sp. dw_358]|uniref:NAD(P)/FAD-dependent oxidoreductase n=1 Tax=Pseudomonas sp. dw_358 TaxID=2720083 RepID=UPI001BD41DE2|nr:FAD-dependent oxidoreductase [Pseudomonas sp. dw_358]
MASKHIIVIGAGAVGLSSARAALLRGHRVTVIEQGSIPHSRSASFDQHRLIRYQYGRSPGYTLMVSQAFDAWERLWQDLDAQHFHRTGTLGISLAEGDYASTSGATMAQVGIEHQWLDAAGIEALCPHLQMPAHARGLYSSTGGVLFADRIVIGLAAWCRAHGAKLLANTQVQSVDTEAGRVHTTAEMLEGDQIVIAAGAWLPGLLPAYSELRIARQAVCYVQAPEQHRAHWANGPCITDLGEGANYALMPVQGTGLKFGSGQHRRLGSPADGFAGPPEEGYDVIRYFAPYLRDAEAYRSQRMQVGYYVLDSSDAFRVEPQGKALVVTNCGGGMFKFSALMGERVIACLDHELTPAQLQHWAAGKLPVTTPELS